MKRLVRSWVAQSCRAVQLLARQEKRQRGRLVILCYHRILPAAAKASYFQPDLVVTPEAFRGHLTTLADYYSILPLREAWSVLQADTRHDRPLAAITFDDGYRDNHRYAAPLLAERGLRATFFIVSDLVGAQQPPWYDRVANLVKACATRGRRFEADSDVRRILEEVAPMTAGSASLTPGQAVAWSKRLTPDRRKEFMELLRRCAGSETAFAPDDLIMDWRELSELAQAGHEIGSHSRTHPILTQLDDEHLRDELAGSRSTIEKGLKQPVVSFCYPNGDLDDRVEAAVTKAGYDCAVTVEAGINTTAQQPLRLRRWFIHEDRLRGGGGRPSSALLRLELCGLAEKVFRRRVVPANP